MSLNDEERRQVVLYRLEKAANGLFTMRLTGDYGDCFDLLEEDVAPKVEPTQKLVNTVAKLARTTLEQTTKTNK